MWQVASVLDRVDCGLWIVDCGLGHGQGREIEQIEKVEVEVEQIEKQRQWWWQGGKKRELRLGLVGQGGDCGQVEVGGWTS